MILKCPIDNLPCNSTGCSFCGGWNEQCHRKNINSAIGYSGKELAELLRQERNKTIDECWRNLEKIDPWLLSEDELKKKLEALKS